METPSFKDHFSGRSADYTLYRPSYPPQLFSWLASLTSGHDLAWDCGCGSGQAALELVHHYTGVIATDPSRQQIDNAIPHEGIRYAVATAEASGLEPGSIDLVVVAQALHWFDFDRFYAEVERVTRPDGVIAAISYGEVRVAGAPDPVVSRFYHDLIGPCWPPERRYVDEGYATIPFPFPEITAPSFAMTAEWNLEHLLGYFRTWSAVKEYEKRNGADPLQLIGADLAAAWGDSAAARSITWPLSLRVGRVGGRSE